LDCRVIRVCLFEHFTSGGRAGDGCVVNSDGFTSLNRMAAEGRAMASALAEDLAAIRGVEVVCLRDARLSDWRPSGCRVVDVSGAAQRTELLGELAAKTDWTVVIAPETGGVLTERCERVVATGGRLLGPPPALVALASDKHQTAQHLSAAGVAVPRGVVHQAGRPVPRDFSYPAVWKPLDGAGSELVELISRADSPSSAPAGRLGRLEVFQPGIPASVALLCGPNCRLALPPCSQQLSNDGRFRYLGGTTLLPAPLAARATRLAERAIVALPGAFGYIGVDLVLGACDDGADDCVIEINPRLTTSYVGLRAACNQNLAHALLNIAQGAGDAMLTFRTAPLTFSATGRVEGSGARMKDEG
jgi:tyramine---L-glutamate ligase